MTRSCSIKVAALTGGKNEPSARFRVRQLIPTLLQQGVEIHEYIPFISKYPPVQKTLRTFWAMGALCGRIPAVVATHRYDVSLLQRELVSTLVTLEPLTKRPRVLDVDDAIHLHRRGRFARTLAQQSDLVICGNDFLAECYANWSENVVVIPTAVDTRRFTPRTKHVDMQRKVVIGWIGTSSNFKYLYGIETALERVLKLLPHAILLVIADKEPRLRGVPWDRLSFVRWSPETEIKEMQNMTVGIMPLANTEWARGKCSYKMLQYMACGIPVVVSPVGMNAQVLSLGEAGIGAKSQEDWTNALLEVLSLSEKEQFEMGVVGRRIVEERFSIEVIAPQIARQLKQLSL